MDPDAPRRAVALSAVLHRTPIASTHRVLYELVDTAGRVIAEMWVMEEYDNAPAVQDVLLALHPHRTLRIVP